MLARGGLKALLVGLVLAGAVAFAQGSAWTVQTVALRDLRQADGVVAQLRNLGFDAYDEFAMHDGKQFVRVRVGCYLQRAAAQAAADALAKNVTEQAVVAAMTPGAKVDGCVSEDVGFLKPASWQQVQAPGGLPTFHVRVAGHEADLVFDGSGWRVVQAGGPAPIATATSVRASFVAAHPGDVPWVAQEVPSGTRLLCPGHLIGQRGKAAVVDRPDEVVACSLAAVPVRIAKGAGP